jgi:PBSX family phage terminase large subunit
MASNKLKPPKSIRIEFKPSSRQYELWKLLQPDHCPHCGGKIDQVLIGRSPKRRPQYKAQCLKCHSQNLPQLILGGGAAGGGKQSLLDSVVCTPSGFRKVRDLKVGDIITSATTGGQQRIIQLHPILECDYYRIHFIDGTHFDCSSEHLWQLHQAGKKEMDRNRPNECVWETQKMYEWIQKKKSGMYSDYNLTIPLCAPVQFAITVTIGNPKPIPPYILGALLGNGCITNSCISNGMVNFTTMDDEIVSEFRRYGYIMDYWTQKPGDKAKGYHIKNTSLICGLKEIGLAGRDAPDKCIPVQYKYSTIQERMELIQGLMDTNGYIDSREHLSISTTGKPLADDIAFIIRSLGGIATITENRAGYKNENDEQIACDDSYDIHFVTKMNRELVRLSCKKERCRDRLNSDHSELRKRIVDIKPVGKRIGRCITVDEPCGLYVADDFTVTHNSYLGSVWLISSCIRFDNIRAVVARKTLKSLKESTWNTIKSILKDWGLKEDLNFKINNLEGTLTFWNDSVIIMKEMADTPSDPNFERFGSSEYTIAFVDEVSEISERAIEVLFSRLRWRIHETFKTSRMLMTTNPTINWVRSRFVQDENGEKVTPREGEAYIPFSVYDNPNVAFRQTYEAALNKIRDQATKERLLYGNWDFVETNDMAIYNKFDGSKHLVTGLKEQVYNPSKPLITVWDFNVAPQMSTLTAQIDYDNKKVYILEEIVGKPENKENNTPALSRKMKNKLYRDKHTGGVDITGDPAGLQRATASEDGINNYTIILDILGSGILRPKLKLLKKQPPQVTRCDFVNEVFAGYKGWEIRIDICCRKLTEDLIYQLKNNDGTKSKQKVTDQKTGVKYEKYGHLSDCLDYLLCYYLRDNWYTFKNGNSGTASVLTTAVIYEGFNY